jgi:hypothetical protein
VTASAAASPRSRRAPPPHDRHARVADAARARLPARDASMNSRSTGLRSSGVLAGPVDRRHRGAHPR